MIIVVGSALIHTDNAILFVRETKPAAKDKYGLPGGKLEQGETLEDCVVRECKEETGLDIHINDLVAITHKPSTHEGNNVVRFIYQADIATEGQDEHEMRTRWLTIQEIRELAEKRQIRGKDVVSLSIQYLESGLSPIPKPILFD